MRSMSFLVNDRSTGGLAPAVAVTIIENGDGSLSFSLNVLGPYTGDLRGFFFDVADESRIGTLTVAPTSAGFTEFRQGNDTIKDLGNGANMQGLLGSDGGYDGGIEIGSAGIGKKDDYQSFSFTLTSSAGPLTLEDFSNVDFGLRLDSVGWVGGHRDDAVKLLEHTSSAIDARDDANALTEDQGPNQVGGNVFDNDVNLGPVRLVVAVNGSAGDVGDEIEGAYGTLRLNLNGSYTYTLDNAKAQALAAGQEATETFSYTAKKFDELTSFSSDSANLTITITGTNDGPVIAGTVLGQVYEDGAARAASGQLTHGDVDDDAVVTWSLLGPAGLGNASVDATGRWTYNLNNGAVQSLAQDQTVLDSFIVRATDQHGASDEQTVTVSVGGTGDRPILPPAPLLLSANEDGGPALGTTSAFDVDASDLLHWSLNRGSTLGYFSDYEFRAERFGIEKNGAALFLDEFDFGGAPPSAPNFSNNMAASYTTTGVFREIDGKLVMGGSDAFAFRGTGNDALVVGNEAILATNVDPANTVLGLKKNHQFVVDGVFDLIEPQLARQAYGLTMTDAVGQVADDLLGLTVRRDPVDDQVYVQFANNSGIFDTAVLVDRDLLVAGGADQIRLILSHEADAGDVSASYQLLTGGLVTGGGSLGQVGIFGTDTPGFAGDDENWIRAGLFSNAPDPNELVQTLSGTYGTLTVSNPFLHNVAELSYAPGAGAQALAQGESIVDSFFVRAVDPFGLSSSQRVEVTVTGANDAPDITGGVTTGLVYEDGGARVASGQLSAVDVDHGAVVSWSTLGTPTYGFASVDMATGRWSYTLDNTRFATQQLAQGESVTDSFTVRVSDEHGAFDAGSEQLVSVEIRGTNDRPNLPAAPLALSAFEDGGAASTATTAFDIDNGSVLHWSLNRGSMFGYFSPYEFRAESFSIQKNGNPLFHDEFNAGGPPPSAPDFLTLPPGVVNPATSYSVSGALSETGGKLVFLGSQTIGFRGTGIDSLIAGNEAILNTNIDPANTVSGLKKNHQFAVEAVFDLVEPALVRQQYGIELTDGFNQIADDLATLFVRREADGLTYVRLADNNSVLDTGSLVGREQLVTDGADQIRLRLSHAADADTVSGSYELLTGGMITGGGSLGELGIFGTDTDFPGDDNNWIRAGLSANALDTNEFVQTLDGAYGTLSVATPAFNILGELTYTAGAAAQSLAQGESVIDSFFVRAVDQFGMTSAQRVEVTVHGANDPVVITSGAQSGTVVEDADATPSPDDSTTAAGTISFSDVDLRDFHSAFFASAPTNTTALGTFILGSVNEAPNAADGFVAWTYVLDNAAAQFLDEGETATETYVISVTDDFGAVATEEVTVTVHGTADDGNQDPVITGGDTTGVAYEDSTARVARGQLTAFDPDPGTILNWSVAAPGAYGGAFVDATGRWTYSLNNTLPAVSQLAQGGATLTDTFTVRAADQTGASDTQAVTVTINGTNDRPILLPTPQSPPPISIAATEDGGPAGAQAQGSDIDVGALLRWSLSRQGASGYFSDYEFRADSFSIEKNFAPLFRDEFNAGGPPPSAPDFIPPPPPGGSSLASYVTSGGFQENPAGDGTLIINGANAAAFRGPGFNGLSVGSEAILATNVDPANTVSGLKKNHQFVVDGVFDLVQPGLARQAYGITLTDAVNQVSDDQLSLVVRHDPDGQVYVQFNNASGILDTSQIVARTLLPLGTGADQIRLRFSHDANSGDISASYELLDDGAAIGIGSTLGSAGIFGTDTPLFAGDDENWTRAGLFGNGVDLNEGIFPNSGVQTLAGQYGTLRVGASGELTYNVDNTNLAVQALNQGQSVVDSFFVRVTDQFGLSASQRVEVTVNGVDEPLNNAPPVAAPDNNDFDAVIEAGVNFSGFPINGDPIASGNVILGSFGVGVDTDPDGDTLLVTAASVGGMAAELGVPIVLTYGSLVINADGSWTYTLDNSDPDTNALRQTQAVFNEPAFEQLVTYTVSDGHGGTDSAELTIRVSGTNDAPIVATDTNSVTEHTLDQAVSVMGNVLTNDSDPEGSALQILGGTPIQGTYGTLTLQSNGDYVYTTDPARVNFLDAGEVAHDIFTGRYAVSEVFEPGVGQTIVNATRLEIAITGTAEAPSNADASVFEDGQRKATGEVDLAGGTIGQVSGTGPMTPWGEYRFRIDNLTITKNGAQFFNDGFDAGGPPPQAPGSNYFTTGTFTETGGRANMDGSLAGSIAAGFAGHTATLNTDTTADLTSGLKQNHAFVLQARFDLVLPDEELETYGIRLTDAIPGGGGDDIVEISVRRQDGNVVVALREANVPGNPPAVLTSIPLVPAASDNRIDLRLEHIAGSDEVMASFNLINGDVVGARIDLGVGHIFGNETWTRAQFLSFSPSMPQNGKYGTLSVEADGDWTYSLRNGIADVQALAQGEAVTDVFTVQINDVLGPRTETVAIDVVGNNDNPNPTIGFNTVFQGTPPAFNGTYVVEGSAPQTSRGIGLGNDLDHSRPVDWSVTANPTPAAPNTPLPAYRSDYAVKATQLNITKDGLNILTDTFNPATPALGSDPNFTYITNAPISESGGAFMNGQQAGSLGGVGTSDLLAGHSAVLDTNIGAASPGRGLKSHNDFKVDARFDYDHLLSLNPGQLVGVSLTDRAVGELAPDQLGDDILTLLVTRDATGFLVQFDERDAVSDSITALGSARLDFAPAAGRQIVLHLEHDKDGANFGRVQASFDLFEGATLLQDGVFAEHLGRADRIFGAETPGNPYDDEVWTRVQLLASGRDSAATQTTAQGRFGDLTVDNDGGWTYTLNPGDPDTLGLAHGQVVADSFNWRATDAYGGSTSRTFNVNVIGTDPAAPGGDKTGTAGNDVLVGSGHAEKLTGGTGSDLLIGLGGSDTFDFNNINEGNDTISDFTPGLGGDVLDIRDVLQGYVPDPGIIPFNYVQLQTFSGPTGFSTTVAVNADGVDFDYIALATLQGVGGLELHQLINDGNLLLG